MRRSTVGLRRVGAVRLRAAASRSPASLTATSQQSRRLGVAARRCFSDFPPGLEESSGDRLHLTFAASCAPHPDKLERGGEDGYFACPRSRSFGVADGVGGWAESGVDPGLFARALLRFAHKDISRQTLVGGDGDVEADLHRSLLLSSKQLAEEKIQGGSTALLGQLNGRILSILNLGDSGVIVLRPSTRPAWRSQHRAGRPRLFPRVLFRSSDQTHYFNCPYQMGSSGPLEEVPDFVRIRVRAGDLLIAGTDGVFDNLFDHQVQGIVAQRLSNAWLDQSSLEPLLQGVATSIAEEAQTVGRRVEEELLTPFGLNALSEGISYRGGKLDDTTAVVGLVCGPPSVPDESADALPQLLHNFC
eukprot:TRINITY_DN67066_c0_g1_i1.p1 TRINITY_DN67066_c0_g1~~TRINITY_DN67066_c0_g1_i1.p1  ORF type:complete len:360 (-),score=32.92 TRINITY_DN67066_c0_g1_i1:117-1196(-)